MSELSSVVVVYNTSKTLLSMSLGALESAVLVGGISALVAGLVSLGIPKDEALKYEAYVKADLLVVHSAQEEVERARQILSETSPISLETSAKAAA